MAKTNSIDSTALAEKKAQALLQGVYKSSPIIAEKLVSETDRLAQSAEFGVARRIGLVMASKGGEWFKEISTMPRDDAAALAIAMQEINLHVQSLRQLANLLERAEVRLMVALCAREDFPDLHDAAIKEIGATPRFTPKMEADHV